MGYRRVKTELIWAIYSRLRSGESNREIGLALGLDKKTVNQYAIKIAELGLPAGLAYDQLLERFEEILPRNTKPKPAVDIFQPLSNEIRVLITGNKEEHLPGMKAKTAWEVISRRYRLTGKTSYESFKRFVRTQSLVTYSTQAIPRIETEPGHEVQVDYGKVGTKVIESRRRVVSAYCGKLSASRLPYIEFVLSQDEVSFAQSTVRMFSFYGGVTERIVLDNLKAGVLSADIYDPTLNHTFAELCEYYDVIADPARPAAPKDKGKVERLVPVARELFRRLDALNPDASLADLNEQASSWCRQEYGCKKHGTTGIPPLQMFTEIERPCLKPVPADPFVPARWLTAKVHPDQFIQIKSHYFGLPVRFIGKQVDVRLTSNLITIYYEHRIVRQYPVSSKRRAYLSEDFLAFAQPFKPGSYAAFLVGKAELFGSQTGVFIRAMLESGGNLSLRRAQACLALIEKHKNDRGFSHVLGLAIAEHQYVPDRLRVLFEDDASQNVLSFPVSEAGKAMTRGATYYTGP